MYLIKKKIEKIIILLGADFIFVKRDEPLKIIGNAFLLYLSPIPFWRMVRLIHFFTLSLSFHLFLYCLYQGSINLNQAVFPVLNAWGYFISYQLIANKSLIRHILKEINNFIFLDTRRPDLILKITKRALLTKYIVYYFYLTGFIVTFLFTPIFGDVENLFFTIKFIRNYFATYYWFSITCQLLFYINLFHTTFIMTSTLVYFIYCNSELLFQMYVLNDRLAEIIEDSTLSFDVLNNKEYQDKINFLLKECARHYAISKQFLVQWQKLTGRILALSDLCVVIATAIGVFFILTYPLIDTILRFSGITFIIFCSAIGFSYYGQKLSNECEVFCNLLYSCPWYLWNSSNRKILLIMLLNSKEPFLIKYLSVITADATFLTEIIKNLYKVVMFLLTMKQKEL